LGAAALAQNWELFSVFMGAGLGLGWGAVGLCFALVQNWVLLSVFKGVATFGFAPAFVAVWLAVCVAGLAGLWAGPGLGLGWPALAWRWIASGVRVARHFTLWAGGRNVKKRILNWSCCCV